MDKQRLGRVGPSDRDGIAPVEILILCIQGFVQTAGGKRNDYKVGFLFQKAIEVKL